MTKAFYRIAREALNNVIIHGQATQVTIASFRDADSARLSIQDDGHGFDPQAIPAGHLGISIMSERAAHIGGELRIQSAPDRGTEIAVTWPRNGKNQGEDG